MPVPGVPPLRPSSASSALRAKVLAQRRESPRFGQKSSFVPASRREPLEVQQLRGAILARFPSHAAAWFRLFDPEACGAVARPAFTAACRRLDLEVEVAGAAFDALARAGGTSARLTLGCLDPEAVEALGAFGVFLRGRCGSVRRALGQSLPRDPKRRGVGFQEFMNACLHVGYETRSCSYRRLFEHLDFDGRGELRLADLELLDTWSSDSRKKDVTDVGDMLLAALGQREPLSYICDLVQLRADPNATPWDESCPEINRAPPLLHAAERGSLLHLEMLISCGADPNAPCFRGQTALHRVAARPEGKVQPERLVGLLCHAGAALDARAADGSTPLHVACAIGKPQAVRALLLYGADATLRDGRGSCCLLLAVNRNDAQCCKALLAGFADPCEEAKDGLSVLEYTLRRNRQELHGMMQAYLEASGLDMDEVPSYAPYAPQPVKAPPREWSSVCSGQSVWPEQRLSQASLIQSLRRNLAEEWPEQRWPEQKSQLSLSSQSLTPQGSRLALGSQLSLSSVRTPRSPSSTRGDRLAVADILELRARLRRARDPAASHEVLLSNVPFAD